VVLNSLSFPTALSQSKNLNLFDFWLTDGYPPNSLYDELLQIAYRQIDERKQEIAGLKTREDWVNRQKR
jgi:hypothetical protein